MDTKDNTPSTVEESPTLGVESSEAIRPIKVERLTKYNPEDAAEIGKLMPHLSERFTDEPVDEDLLRAIINSPYHDQLVARVEGKIVGAATMSLMMSVGAGEEGVLGDFVTDPEYRGRGVGDKVWAEIVTWCRARGVDLKFTSNPSRVDAHRFYKSHGAIVRETTVFQYNTDETNL